MGVDYIRNLPPFDSQEYLVKGQPAELAKTPILFLQAGKGL